MTSTAPAAAPPPDPSPVPLSVPMSVVAMVVPDPDPAAPGTGTDPTTTDPTATGADMPGRLPSGELRRRVAGYLADHPGVDFTPGQIARALSGRSSGAVANALVVLAGLGAAEQTGDRPTRFRATPGSATIAAAPPIVVTGLAPAPTPTLSGRVRSGRAPGTPTGPGAIARIGLAAARGSRAGGGSGDGCGAAAQRAGLPPAPVGGRFGRGRVAEAARRGGVGAAVRAARYQRDLSRSLFCLQRA